MIPLEDDRFWSKVRILGEDDCWLWTAGLNKGGYGHFRDDDQKDWHQTQNSY